MADNASTSTNPTRAFGDLGENYAALFLERNGYRLVTANFKVPVGRNSKGVQVTGEIDLIALDGETLVFVEVKARSSEEFMPVIAAVDKKKQRQITRTARVYRRLFGVWEMPYRFDVVTVVIGDKRPKLELIKDFWNESSFRKRHWHEATWQEY